jgi:isopentenyl-diphosphate delta-isomerase
MLTDQLILIDEANRAIGAEEKHVAHYKGLLHRAFSIFLVDRDQRIVLQQRQSRKYHSGGLWANTCCGHPRPGERTSAAAARRLREEMGVDSALHLGLHARYRADVGGGMHENEYVYVYFGRLTSEPEPNPDEVADVFHVSLGELAAMAKAKPESVAIWLHHYLNHHAVQLGLSINRVPE